MLCRRLLLLKPLSPGLSGYARLQWEGGRTEMQIQLRGLQGGGVRFFWYHGQARELGQAPANPRGEAGLMASVSDNLLAAGEQQALLILSAEEKPQPLMLGLTGPADGGALLEMRAAALALCQKLAPGPAPAHLPPAATAHAPQSQPEHPPKNHSARLELPREIFLPAIDPAPYMSAQERPAENPPSAKPTLSPLSDTKHPVPTTDPTLSSSSDTPCSIPSPDPTPSPSPDIPRPVPSPDPTPSPVRPWADALPALRWPKAFSSLQPYFDAGIPCNPLHLPGWRFVHAADAGGPQGLYLGFLARDGAVRRLAYALRTPHPPTPAFRPTLSPDGQTYQVLWQTPEP